MRSHISKRLSEADRIALAQLLDAPERVEIHGSDRGWRAGVLAMVFSAACLTFGSAPIQAAQSYLPWIDAPVRSLFSNSPEVPVTEAGAAALMRRVGAQEIAGTAVSVKPQVYALPFRGGMNEDQTHERVMQFVFGAPVLVPALGGSLRLQNNLEGDIPRSQSPQSWSYVAKEKGRTGCVLMVSDQHGPAIGALARATGLTNEAALDFALMHESAHCAQTGEVLAASYDLVRHGRVQPERVASGMLGAQIESLIAAGREGELMLSLVPGRSDQLSAERFADGFALLALMAQQRINGQQIEGLIAWRLADASSHNTASFLAFLRDETRRNPVALAALRQDGELGFNAQAISDFLRPRWKSFEQKELAAYRESSAGLRDAISAGAARQADAATTLRGADASTWVNPRSN
ncbi:hypothetical protein [uncultured Variovorax sp.]|uniref:hypothetical protein n=1 Tax=uncultured Variovorax sp. TaxID=114708 RepID=UPI00260E2803|nr:hypothetical protein [uncultured Variovorax sp.]